MGAMYKTVWYKRENGLSCHVQGRAGPKVCGIESDLARAIELPEHNQHQILWGLDIKPLPVH